jgi:lambda repressor-like predicted transcriptional regulator
MSGMQSKTTLPICIMANSAKQGKQSGPPTAARQGQRGPRNEPLAQKHKIGLSGVELARISGLSVQHACRILRGYTPSKRTQDAIQVALANQGQYIDPLEIWPEPYEQVDAWLFYVQGTDGRWKDIDVLHACIEKLPKRHARVIRNRLNGKKCRKPHTMQMALNGLRKALARHVIMMERV